MGFLLMSLKSPEVRCNKAEVALMTFEVSLLAVLKIDMELKHLLISEYIIAVATWIMLPEFLVIIKTSIFLL